MGLFLKFFVIFFLAILAISDAAVSVDGTTVLLSKTTTHNNVTGTSPATSTMYFEIQPSSATKPEVADAAPVIEPIPVTSAPVVVLLARPVAPTSINKTDTQTSETQNYYGYDPWSSSSLDHIEDPGYGEHSRGQGGHYPPIPMDVVHGGGGDSSSENDDFDVDDGDDMDGGNDGRGQQESEDQANNDQAARGPEDGTETGPDFDMPWNSEDDGDPEFDQENSASFHIPKVDMSRRGCKTIYKEISASLPDQGNTVSSSISESMFQDPDELMFRRRRKRETTESGGGPSSSKRASGSYILARECHFTDDAEANGQKNQDNKPSTVNSSGKIESSRFVTDMKSDMDPSPSYREPRFGGQRSAPHHPLMPPPAMMMPSFPPQPMMMMNAEPQQNDGQNGDQQFHNYPYPHYHIYYNNNNRKPEIVNSDPGAISKMAAEAGNFRNNRIMPIGQEGGGYYPRGSGIPEQALPRRQRRSRRRPLLNHHRQPESNAKHFSRSFNYFQNVPMPGEYSHQNEQDRPHERAKKSAILSNDDGDSYDGDDGDYSVSYGGGNYDSYENSYDSDHDKHKHQDDRDEDDGGGHQGDDNGGGGGGDGGGGHYDYSGDYGGAGGGGGGDYDSDGNGDYY